MAGGCDNETVRTRWAFEPGWLPRRLRSAVIVLLVLGVGGFLIDGANRPANPYLIPANGQVREAALSRFGAVTLSITPAAGTPAAGTPAAGTPAAGTPAAGTGAAGTPASVCTLEASTQAQQERGLMGVRSLGHFAGMTFVFSAPSSVLFYMKNTLIPLSVAWFDSSGAYIGSAYMPVCPPGTVCPTYAAGRRFSLALEVPAGRLGALGIGPGSSVHLAGPCSG